MTQIKICTFVKILAIICITIIEVHADPLADRARCESTINHTFPGEDVREHVKLVMNSFTSDDFTGNENENPLIAYFGALGSNLKGGGVPPLNTFCQNYSHLISAALCNGFLTRYFGSNPDVIVIDAFFGHKLSKVQQYDGIFRAKLVAEMGEHFPDIRSVPNIIMDYWKLITEKFAIEVGELIAYKDIFEGEKHMLPPKLFCESRYPN